MSQAELSDLAGVSAATVKRLETSPETRGSAASLFKIEGALEQAGVEFRRRIQGARRAPQARRIRQQIAIKAAQALV
jgi:transcriptional regulator with XRE-family HTH domain